MSVSPDTKTEVLTRTQVQINMLPKLGKEM